MGAWGRDGLIQRFCRRAWGEKPLVKPQLAHASWRRYSSFSAVRSSTLIELAGALGK
jgi:hypothetical protein